MIGSCCLALSEKLPSCLLGKVCSNAFLSSRRRRKVCHIKCPSAEQETIAFWISTYGICILVLCEALLLGCVPVGVKRKKQRELRDMLVVPRQLRAHECGCACLSLHRRSLISNHAVCAGTRLPAPFLAPSCFVRGTHSLDHDAIQNLRGL